MGSAYDVFKYELRGTNNIDEANTKDINAGTSIFEAKWNYYIEETRCNYTGANGSFI